MGLRVASCVVIQSVRSECEAHLRIHGEEDGNGWEGGSLTGSSGGGDCSAGVPPFFLPFLGDRSHRKEPKSAEEESELIKY